MRKNGFLALFIAAAFAASAQTALTTDQMLKGAAQKVTKPLPQFVEWAGENSFIIRREGKQYVHDIKTGKESWWWCLRSFTKKRTCF
jgi:hypothetical protein